MSLRNTIVEVREGGQVRAAVVMEEEQGRLRLLTSEGREMRVPSDRVVHATGQPVNAGGDPAGELRAWEAAATSRAADVDLGELHAFLQQQAEEDSDLDLTSLTLADMSVLALADDGPSARAALHRALASPNPWFQFDGKRWKLRSRAQVEKEVARLDAAARLAAERGRFLDAARDRMRGGDSAIPPGSGKFLRALEELAVHGEAATGKREAGELLAELAPSASPPPVTPERAFEVLHRLGVFEADENLAVLRAGIAEEFTPEVLAAADRDAQRPVTGEGRMDLRGLDLVTIDDVKTHEIDDGLTLEATARGFRLGIHVADPAHFIEPDSEVDREAAARATSYYLPARSIPMLPAVLAEDAASLVEGQDRPALSVLIDLSPHGEVLRSEVTPSLVRVARRMTYEDCETALAGEDAGTPWLPRLQVVARELEAARRTAGATPIRAPEMEITFDEAGEPVIEMIDPGRPARQLVSEMMILANRILAEWVRDRGLPAIYRRQSSPPQDVTPPPVDRYDPVAVNRFRRSIQRTDVSLTPGQHAGLGLPAYLQATSPIRRYQDLVMHRIVKAACWGQPSPYTRDQVAAIALATEQAGRQARRVENETDTYWVLRHLERRVDEVLEAVVLRAEDRRTFVELTSLTHVVPVPARPDHQPGKLLRLRVRAVKPRRGTLVVEEL